MKITLYVIGKTDNLHVDALSQLYISKIKTLH